MFLHRHKLVDFQNIHSRAGYQGPNNDSQVYSDTKNYLNKKENIYSFYKTTTNSDKETICCYRQ